MKSIISVAVLCAFAQVGESYLTSGFGGGIIGGGVYPSYPSYPSYPGYPGTTCCCCCCTMGGQMTTTPQPIILPPIQISTMPCCPCPPQQPLQQQQCCNFVSPYQVPAITAATAAPVGVPDIITGPCGEIIVPLFNPPVSATSQVVGK
ncbi:hypothetical protein Y032_0395g654 [Ancylostoma ceylanicum]|uniref:Uncharacterized protein n=1 Tax=Ancylostoma ceylanicum TaxID=53326 RepID=A0A016RRH9_9BILA|nr:hypothetical protein Y032_0395g654 [Ancylostoma ceylanicum]